jgi:hypothetical protein
MTSGVTYGKNSNLVSFRRHLSGVRKGKRVRLPLVLLDAEAPDLK